MMDISGYLADHAGRFILARRWRQRGAVGGQPGADLAADLAAIEDSFGVLAEREAFPRRGDDRMDYMDGLADA